MLERLALSWEDITFAVIAALVWSFASFVCCPLISVRFMSKAGVEITAAIPSLGPLMGSIEDDDRESLEDDLQLCALPGVRLIWPPSLALSQITSPQNVSLAALTPAQHPLRC